MRLSHYGSELNEFLKHQTMVKTMKESNYRLYFTILVS
jgi:hypothetical protein